MWGRSREKKDNEIDGLYERHAQHKRDTWYKNIGDENLICEYIHMDSDADADIYETYLIALIETLKDNARRQSEVMGNHDFNEGDWELENKAKRWGVQI